MFSIDVSVSHELEGKYLTASPANKSLTGTNKTLPSSLLVKTGCSPVTFKEPVLNIKLNAV